jgi:hypothetical protein
MPHTFWSICVCFLLSYVCLPVCLSGRLRVCLFVFCLLSICLSACSHLPSVCPGRTTCVLYLKISCTDRRQINSTSSKLHVYMCNKLPTQRAAGSPWQ